MMAETVAILNILRVEIVGIVENVEKVVIVEIVKLVKIVEIVKLAKRVKQRERKIEEKHFAERSSVEGNCEQYGVVVEKTKNVNGVERV